MGPLHLAELALRITRIPHIWWLVASITTNVRSRGDVRSFPPNPSDQRVMKEGHSFEEDIDLCDE